MIIALLGLFGLVLGSFVNAFVWRLHEQEELRSQILDLTAQKGKKRQIAALEAQLKARSISKGRSMCPHCQHELAARDLAPVFSWLFLRGKCRYCRQPISWQYPLVELLTAGLFIGSYLAWSAPFDAAGIVGLAGFLIFIVFFMALAVYDLRWYLLPDAVVLPLILLATGYVVTVAILKYDLNHNIGHLWQPVLGAALLSGLFWTLYQVSKGTWIGGGDVKLAVVLGLLAGTPLNAMLLLFFASLLGTVASIPLLVRNGRNLKVKIPFGPFLLAATVLVVLFGQRLVDSYAQLFRLG